MRMCVFIFHYYIFIVQLFLSVVVLFLLTSPCSWFYCIGMEAESLCQCSYSSSRTDNFQAKVVSPSTCPICFIPYHSSCSTLSISSLIHFPSPSVSSSSFLPPRSLPASISTHVDNKDENEEAREYDTNGITNVFKYVRYWLSMYFYLLMNFLFVDVCVLTWACV